MRCCHIICFTALPFPYQFTWCLSCGRFQEVNEHAYTDMRHLTAGMGSEKCVVRRFGRFANVIECTYTNLDSIAYYTPGLYGIAYCC